MEPATNPYDVLGVPRDADPSDIKKAYRKRAAAAHPDKGGSDAEAQAINEAWETLGDPERRARYDATGEVEGAGPAMSPGERFFIEALEGATRDVLKRGSGSISELVRERLIEVRGGMVRSRNKVRDQIDGISLQSGRYVSRVTEENLIESMLRGIKENLAVQLEDLDRGLDELSAAITIAEGYADAAPPDVRHYQQVVFCDVMDEIVKAYTGTMPWER